MAGILVHEWLAERGGSENVFEVLSETFPDAERWCLWNDSNGRFEGVNETVLARSPLRGKKALSVPFMPLAWRMLPERDADWVLVSSHAFAHHARFRGPARDVPKLVYAHTPARYVWVPEADGRGRGLPARALSSALRPLDRARAQEPVAIAANSQYVADRILNTWGREAEVIYPPVDVDRFASEPDLRERDLRILKALPDRFVLGASRFVEYKRLEEAIRVGALADIPVVLAGGGPDEARLRAVAESSAAAVHFVSDPSQALLSALYRRAALLVFAPIEDFGIMPVEAMASGTPVLVNAVGGAAESVIDGVTGAHVREWADLSEVNVSIGRALTSAPEDCLRRAGAFGVKVFQDKISTWVAAESGVA
ncbi:MULTISPECIES: glycosyltransferase [Microbacterium]|uniref:glycosyltransferase n=1 Tax=Microbacterium TaxID=33882 RepID=UPI00344FB4FE